MRSLRHFSARAVGSFACHRTLLVNAGFLTLAASVSALFGFVFWLMTARTLSPEEQGLAAAIVSTMNMLAFIGEFSFGTLLIGRVKSAKSPGGLISAALLCSLLPSLTLATVFLAFSDRVAPQSHEALDSNGLVFLLGVAAMTVAIIVDSAAIGLLASWARAVREIVFSILRLSLLACLFWVLPAPQASDILAVWIAALLISFACTAAFAARRRELIRPPAFSELRASSGEIVAHHALNLGAIGPSVALPLLVTEVLSPATNAVFYATWMLLQAAMLVPFAAATALFSTMAADPQIAGSRLRFSMLISAAFGVVGGVACYLFLPAVLRVFNPAYPEIAGSALDWLGFSLLPIMIKSHYIAVMRLAGRMMTAAVVVGVGALFEFVAAIAGGLLGGLFGLAMCWMAAITVQAVVQLPTILAASGWRRLRRAKAAKFASAPHVAQIISRGSAVIVALLSATALAASGQSARAETGFVSTRGTQFVLDGATFSVAGVNNHYLTYGSKAEVLRVLDDAVAMHANVVRTFLQPVVGSFDGKTPTIWNWNSTSDASNLGVNGVYMLSWDSENARMAVNDGLDGMQRIDFLLDEARKRHLKVIVAFLDFWPYTGGAQQMRAWYGSDDVYTFFAKDPRTINDYKRWAATVIGRVNSINGVRYADDPTIFAWELMNEPDIHPVGVLQSWLQEMAAHVKALDANHLLASGHGNATGDFHDLPIDEIDFGTWHGYPRFNAITPAQMTDRIREFCAVGAAHGKPVLLEEFGWSSAHADQPAVYQQWLDAIYDDANCPGWIAWRLVARQDSGAFPSDIVDGFDLRNDGGLMWSLMSAAALRQTSKPSPPSN